MPAEKPTEPSRIKLKIERNSPSPWSASIQPTGTHCRLAFTPGSADMYACCCYFQCSSTGKRFSNREETGCLPLLNAGFEPWIQGLWNRISSRLNARWQTDWAIYDQAKKLNSNTPEATPHFGIYLIFWLSIGVACMCIFNFLCFWNLRVLAFEYIWWLCGPCRSRTS